MCEDSYVLRQGGRRLTLTSRWGVDSRAYLSDSCVCVVPIYECSVGGEVTGLVVLACDVMGCILVS